MAEESGGGLKDVTVTSFGLLIAYLLPGFAGLYGLGFWWPELNTSFRTFLTSESNVGLFFILVLASLIVGLIAHGIRWILFEVWFRPPNTPLDASHFARLSGPGKYPAFRTAVDEIYRYHQWWGGIAVVAPVLFIGWVFSSSIVLWRHICYWAVFLAFEALTLYAAKRTWIWYVQRVKAILNFEGGTE